MSEQELLRDEVFDFLRAKGGTKASAIAKAIRANRKDVNQILYREKGTSFELIGTDPPVWYLMGKAPSGISVSANSIAPQSVKDVLHNSGIDGRRVEHAAFINEEISRRMGVSLRYAHMEIDVDLVERGLSDPYVTFEMESPTKMTLIVNCNLLPATTHDNEQGMYQHIIHCAADAIALRLLEESQTHLEREDIFAIKSRVLFDLLTTDAAE